MSPPSKVRASLLAGKALAPINSAKFQIWLATEMLGAQTLGIDSCLQMEGGALDTFFPLAALSCSRRITGFFFFSRCFFRRTNSSEGPRRRHTGNAGT
jgi:hypothetical protein